MSGLRPRVLLEGLGALVCVGVLVTAFVLAAAADATQSGKPAHHVDLSGLLEPVGESEPGVRRLPLLDAAGPVVRGFPDGRGLENPTRVRAVIEVLAGRLGLLPVIEQLLTTPLGDPSDELDLDLYRSYPYAYPAIDAIVDASLTPESVVADPEAVLDLAGLLLLDAVRSQREKTGDVANAWAGVAYSLLRRASDVASSCEFRLDLLFVMSMGFAPHIADVEAEAERAVAACPGDPTPSWLLGQVQTVQASLIASFFAFERGPRAMTRAAEETFAGLRRDYPDSPLGWAGTADLYLQLADEAEQLTTQPFQVRAWRREALELYAEARRRSADPALLAGFGRALSVNGRHDEAIEALTDLEELIPGEPAYQMLLIDALGRAGRPDDIVATIDNTPVLDRPLMVSLSVSPRRAGAEEPASAAFGLGGTRAGSVYDQSQKFNAGSSASDLGFVPVSNGRWTVPWCRAGAFLSALVQEGDAHRAWTLVRDGLDPESWDGVVDCHGRRLDRYGDGPDRTTGLLFGSTALGQIGMVAALETKDPAVREEALARITDEYSIPEAQLSEALDGRSDFWRAVGDRDRARAVVDDWVEELPEDPWAKHRAGELAFLDDDYDQAVEEYERARELFGSALDAGTGWGDHGFGQYYVAGAEGLAATGLELGAAFELDGRVDRARTTYLQTLDELGGDLEFTDAGNELSWYTRSQLGSLALARGDLREAVLQLTMLLDDEYGEEGPPGPGDEVGTFGYQLSRGAQDNNLALALAKLGRHDESIAYAESALVHDPVNPIYVDTVAFAHDLAGHEQQAAAVYRRALAADATSYVSANNLAVILAQDGHRAEAAAVLESAVTVAPEYAIGWHNLGVVRAPESADLLSSQGAHALAGRLDRQLRGQDDLIVDTEIYRSGLDVSKPLPPDWTYGASASGTRERLTLSVILLLLLRVVWALGFDTIVAKVGERVMTRPGRSAPTTQSRFWRRLPAWCAVLACGVVVAVPLTRAGHSAAERAVLAGAGVALVMLPLLVRWVARVRTEVAVGHYSWAPAVVVGAAGVPFGLVFAPYPVLDAARPGLPVDAMDRHPHVTRLRLVVPVVLALVATTFVVLAAFDPTPLARALALTSVAVLGSALVPVPPLDGSHLRGRVLNVIVTLALAAVTAAFALKWI